MEDFYFYSEILQRWVCIKAPFDFDWESVPVIRGTSKIAGLIHDYLSRYDSDPKVTKLVAAAVYREAMIHRHSPEWRREFKYLVVIVWPGYFHQKSINWVKEAPNFNE